MTFSLFQAHLPFHSVFPYLQFLPPKSQQSPEDWSGAEAQSIKIGDLVVVLEPIFSKWGNPSGDIGVSEGDKFRIAQVLLVYKLDAGYPVSIALSAEAFESQFVETVLCVKADMARLAGQGFYYLLARPKKELGAAELQSLEELQKWGSNGSRIDSKGGLAEPAYHFLSKLNVPVDASFAKQPLDIEMLAFYLFSESDAAPAGRAPDLNGYFNKIKKKDAGAKAGSEASSAPAAEKSAGAGVGLLDLLADDWTPSAAPVAAPAPPLDPISAPQDSGIAADIASIVDGIKQNAPELLEEKVSGGSGFRQPPAPPPDPPLPHLKSANQDISSPPESTAPQVTPPPPVPLYGAPLKEGADKPKPSTERKVTLEALLGSDGLGSASKAAPAAGLERASAPGDSLADGLAELAKTTEPKAAASSSADPFSTGTGSTATEDPFAFLSTPGSAGKAEDPFAGASSSSSQADPFASPNTGSPSSSTE
ncbi:MAG: hypothetical protein K2X27_02470, partial [Candidatus Obscuribacterales bacterium]|nr:hypothetical protein [Candidatus Obscuribacterales bacterium]